MKVYVVANDGGDSGPREDTLNTMRVFATEFLAEDFVLAQNCRGNRDDCWMWKELDVEETRPDPDATYYEHQRMKGMKI